MAILHVRNIPETLFMRLKQRAKEQRRSLSAEVIILLEWAIEEADRASGAPLESIRRRRFYEPAVVGAPDSTTLLREDRER
jgi:plasmid stability protein